MASRSVDSPAAARRLVTSSRGLGRGHRCIPGGEWIRHMISRIDPGNLMESFNEKISFQLDRLEALGMLDGRRMDVAIDMHDISRWDGKHGAELVRSKAKNGTSLFERYITVQCVNSKVQLTLGTFPVPALEDNADFVRGTVRTCKDKGVRIGVVLLDRGFFSTAVVRVLKEEGVHYLMPCVNTSNVIKALTEFAEGKRPGVSRFRIAKSEKDYVEYDMIITGRRRKRRRKKGREADEEKPEERYIAFATNMPKIDIGRYAKRWVIETGFRMVENERVRTRSKSPTARTYCFLYSLILFNAWVIANAELTCNPHMLGGAYSRITQTDMKMIILAEVVPWDLIRPEPPDPPCPCCAATCRSIGNPLPLPQ